jgi:subtilisin family serine protease
VQAQDEIVVRARPGTATAELAARLAAKGLSLTGHVPNTGLFSVSTHGQSPAAAVEELAHDSLVFSAQPDYLRHAFATPNDPYFASAEQYLDTIRLPEGWDVAHGPTGLVIGVLDTGVAPVGDLSAQLLPGRNIVGGNTDARDDSVIGHGTLVAGVAAATTNNGIGIAGAAWDSAVMPVKVLDNRGAGSDFQVAAGIAWAVDHGARILNLSLGGPASGSTLCDAVGYAQAHGVLVIASAGNSASSEPNYPAACPGVLGVSATDTDGDFALFSSFGPWVGIAAPGVAIFSTRPHGTFGFQSGTSLAAPIVSGVAALVWASHPEWSASDVLAQIERTAQDRGPAGIDPYYGNGLLDAYAALGGPTQAPLLPTGDAFEPNDDQSHATSIYGWGSATISPEGDVDWYLARIRWPCVMTFELDGAPPDASSGPNFRPVLQLYDEDGNLLTSRDDGATGRITISARVRPGRYYLRVANHGGSRSPGQYGILLRTVHVHRVAMHTT